MPAALAAEVMRLLTTRASYRNNPRSLNPRSTCSIDQSSDSTPDTVIVARVCEGNTYISAIGRAVASNCARTDSSVRPRSRISR